jgi:hypothetical protein
VLFKAPVTETFPAEIPPVTIALLENAVVPVPARAVAVIEPEVLEKLSVPALLNDPRLRPDPETFAVAPLATVILAAEL